MRPYAIPIALWATACAGLAIALVAGGLLESLGTALSALPLFAILLRWRSRSSITRIEKVAS